MKIEFEVTLVTAAVKLTILPGDKVMLHNGMILGIAPKTESTPAPAKAPPTVSGINPTASDVLSALREFTNGLTMRELGDVLKIPREDSLARGRVSRMVHSLESSLHLAKDHSLSLRYPRYRLSGTGMAAVRDQGSID